MQTKPSLTLIGSRRTKVSILGVILVVAAITASLLIWQPSATPLPVQLSVNTSARPVLDRHEHHSQAGPVTCRSVGPDELHYVGALLNDAQLQRYLDGRQCPPA
jgi:hypothetical protein